MRPKRVVLNERKLNTPEEAHERLAEKLGFPDYYGANLDALEDCLSEIRTPTRIVLERDAAEPKPWFDGFVDVVRDSAQCSCYLGCTIKQT